MADPITPEPPGLRFTDPARFSRSMADIAERSQRLVGEWLRRQAMETPSADPLNIGRAFIEMTGQMMANPARLVQVQLGFWQDYMTLWQTTARRMMGVPAPQASSPGSAGAAVAPGVEDAWKDSEVFDFIKQTFLLCARYVQDVIAQADALQPETAQKVDFYSRQFIDAMRPAGFLSNNPDLLRRTGESGGENLLHGLNNLLSDLEHGRARLRIRPREQDAFALGRSVAISPGKVIFKNDLMQLIQYKPTTVSVWRRPLLIIPPWINKFYVLDLRPKNSMVRWLVAQGHTVFMVSWVNPDARLAERGFDDYMRAGVFEALDAIEAATGEREVNAIGHCLGGTLLGASLAYMAAREDRRIASATFFVTLLDFRDPGEINVFIDEEQIKALEDKMSRRSDLEDFEGSITFNLLRANDLIWSFVVNNYLLGHEPFPTDLLYWNSDSTRIPGKMHSFYLRQMYRRNRLVEPGGISLSGVPLDLSQITAPAYFIATREDHIAPWRTSYLGARALSGPVRFVLAASGHIAGVINPPASGKYSYWMNSDLPETPEEWLAGATEMAGSWWPDWQRWVSALSRDRVPARGVGKALEDAPGSYVRMRMG
jgi:polyhydroxyalkanoate synthase